MKANFFILLFHPQAHSFQSSKYHWSVGVFVFLVFYVPGPVRLHCSSAVGGIIVCVPSSPGGCSRPDPNRRRRSEPSFLPDDELGCGKLPRMLLVAVGVWPGWAWRRQRGRQAGFGVPIWDDVRTARDGLQRILGGKSQRGYWWFRVPQQANGVSWSMCQCL